jgi:hypothetical protein
VKRFLPIAIATCIITGFAQATQSTTLQTPHEEITQTPEELLSLAIQSIGGRKQLNALSSFQLHGVMRLPDNRPVVEIELATQTGGKVLGVMTYLGIGQSRFGSDGVIAWEQNLGKNGEVTWNIIDSKSLSQKVQQMNWLEWFTMLPTQLSDMKVIGSEEFDGEQCWIIQIEKKGEKEQLAFFSKKTHRPKGRRTVEKTNKDDITVDIFFRDWERIEDLLLFHTVVFSRDNTTITLKLDRIVLNKASDSLFSLPAEVIDLREKE